MVFGRRVWEHVLPSALHRPRRGGMTVMDGAIMLGLSALALLVRLHALGNQSLWLDEAWQVWYSSLPIHTILTLLPQNDIAPPFYYVALHWWIGMWGRSEWAVR